MGSASVPRLACVWPASDEGEEDATVLVVDDQCDLRSVIRDVLQDEGYRVLEASNPEEALRVAEESDERIDLLVSDLIMPPMGGRELAARFAIVRPEARVLFISGDHADAEIRAAVRAGSAAFLPKPFKLEQFLEKVRDVLLTAPASALTASQESPSSQRPRGPSPIRGYDPRSGPRA